MTKYGSAYERERARFKAAARQRGDQCYHCRNRKGPVDYDSKYDPKKYNPLLFSLEHLDPTSLGADSMDITRWRTAHLVCNVSRGNTSRGQFPTSRTW